MADLSVIRGFAKDELAELVSVLAYRIGELPDRAVAEARFHAATRRAELAMAETSARLDDYVRTRELHDRILAEGQVSRLGPELARLARAHAAASRREREALDRAWRLGREIGR